MNKKSILTRGIWIGQPEPNSLVTLELDSKTSKRIVRSVSETITKKSHVVDTKFQEQDFWNRDGFENHESISNLRTDEYFRYQN